MLRIPPGVRRALRLPSNAERLAHELDDEVRFHIEMRVAEMVARGMSESDARVEALRRFGDTDDLHHYVTSIETSHMRRMRFREWWEGWMQDVRFALRQFSRAPGFLVVAVTTLALGIAATTSIFSVVRGVLLRPLPYPEPERIVQLWQLNNASSGAHTQFSDANFDDVRDRSRSFAALAEESATGTISVSGMAEPVRTKGAVVSKDFFDVFGVKPMMGRLFLPEELQHNGAPAVLVSRGFWERSLGGSADALGRKLLFDGRAFTVVGVMPPNLDFPAEAELWIPRELEEKLPSRTAHNWQVVGRLKDGVTLAQAHSDVSTIATRLRQQYGDDTWMLDVAVVPLQEQIVGSSTTTLIVLLTGSLLLLFIACANVVNLLVARMSARQGEIAVRVALGAGRGRIVQQCLAEALLLSVAAAALGVLAARAGVKLLLLIQPGNLPRMQEVRIDLAVLLFAIGVCIVAAVCMGLMTAWRGTRGELREALAQSQRTQGGTMSSERVRRVLVVVQMATAVVLLVAAGLFGRSFARLLSVDPGFRAERQVVLDISTNAAGAERVSVYDDLLARFRGIPGVTDAGGINVMPLSPSAGGNGTFLILNDVNERIGDMKDFARLMKDQTRTGSAEFRVASPGYFKAMGVPLLRGRLFEERDNRTAPHVAVISASLAKTRWPTENPIGKVIQFGNMDGDLHPFTIVGVVGDVREESLAADPRPTFYASYRQRPVQAWHFNFVLSTSADPAAIINTARRIVRDARPDLPPRIRTIQAIVSGSVADRRFVLSLVAVFGIAALVLAALGVYSVISYLVTQRAREISIRVALGARSEDIVRLVVSQGFSLAAVGILLGGLVAFAATRLISKMLYGVSATDPTAFVAVALLLAAAALVASWVPARRAARMQAMEVLRVG
jgi:putative ABC transport system permease protein